MADDEGKFIADYESGERLLSPFVFIALPGSDKHPVPVNTKTLDYYNCGSMDIDCLISLNDEQLRSYSFLSSGERLYWVYGACAEYDTSNLPNLLSSSQPSINGLMGFFSESSVKSGLTRIHKYFSDPDAKKYFWGMELVGESKKGQTEMNLSGETEADDDIPF